MTKKIFVGMILVAAVATGCKKTSRIPAGVAARVNGKDILRSDVDKYFDFKMQEAQGKPTGEAATLAKMEILRDLIDREIMAQKAEQLKIKVKDADVDAQFQQLRGQETPEEFKKDLKEHGLAEQDVKKEIRQALMVQALVKDQVDSKIHVSDAEVNQFYDRNKESFNVRETQYHLGQIVVTPNPSVPVTNLKEDKALNRDQAVAKVQRISAMLRSGQDFTEVAREYSEDPQTARSGGDLGYQPASSLDRLGPKLKQAIMKLKVGEVTPVIQTPQAFWILKLLDKREPGQRTLQDPEVVASIREELKNRKEQLLSSAFSEQLRNEAHVENYMVQGIIASFQNSK